MICLLLEIGFVLTAFLFCEQKPNLEELLGQDEQLADIELPLPETIYRDSKHRLYTDRWAAAEVLRDRARDLDPRDQEEKWSGLMANFVFNKINDQASQ